MDKLKSCYLIFSSFLGIIAFAEFVPIFAIIFLINIPLSFLTFGKIDLFEYASIWESLNFFLNLGFNIVGTSYVLINPELLIKRSEKPLLIISNHSTAIDFLLLLDILKKPIGFPVKAEMFKIPVIK